MKVVYINVMLFLKQFFFWLFYFLQGIYIPSKKGAKRDSQDEPEDAGIL